MIPELQQFRERAASWRNHAALLQEAAETLDRFASAVEVGDVTRAVTESEAAQVLQAKLEGLGIGGNVFRFEVKL